MACANATRCKNLGEINEGVIYFDIKRLVKMSLQEGFVNLHSNGVLL